jgi:hypothetical protein
LSAAADRYARAVTSDEQAAPVTPAPASAEPTRSHRVRNLVLILVAFVLVLGGLAAGTAFYFYDKATAIDRSTPQISTDQFLNATLIQKDPNRVNLFICKGWSPAAALAATAPPTTAQVSVNWGAFKTTINGTSAVVVLDMQFAASSGGTYHRQSETWTLNLAQEDGWRVCGLSRGASLEP